MLLCGCDLELSPFKSSVNKSFLMVVWGLTITKFLIIDASL
jgi:hypothetical protein